MYMCLSLAIVFYSLWTVDATTIERTSNLLVWTVPIIIILCMKYSMDIEQDSFGDPADVIFGDKVLLGLAAIYGVTMMLLIYLPIIL